MRSVEEIDVGIVQSHLERLRSTVRLPFPLSEFRAYRVQLEEADVARLVLWWQFAKRTHRGSGRVVDLLTDVPPHRRTVSFMQGDPARGFGSVDLRSAEGLQPVAVTSDMESDMLYIIDGNNRVVAQQITHASFHHVPLFLCVHPRINQWSYITEKLPGRLMCSSAMHEIVFREVLYGSEAYEATVELRRRVLREPLGLSFSQQELADERRDYHLAGYRNGRLVGCLVLVPRDGERIKMRQVAIVPELQGQGIGRRLVGFAEAFARQRNHTLMILHARESAVPFYERQGYARRGVSFEEVTLPHWRMEKPLTGSA